MMAQVGSKYGQVAVSTLLVAIVSSLSSTNRVDSTCLSSTRNNSLRGLLEPIKGLPTDCGRHWGKNHRIAGGREAYDGEFPSYISLHLGDNFCGGIIISDRHILSAAHCFENMKRKNLLIRSGKYLNIKIQKVCIDPKYDVETTHNDLAIVKLSESIQFSTFQQPACLPSEPISEDQTYIAIGMGAIDENLRPSSKLKVLKVRPCGFKIWTKLCISPDFHGMMCGGDSGSGVYAIRNNRHTVIGIQSIGDPGCDANNRGIAFPTDIYEMMNSIRNLMRNCG